MENIKEGTMLITTERCQHGDWKTVASKPEKYPPLEKGTRVKFIRKWMNLYGIWVRVHAPNERIYDLKKSQLKVTDNKMGYKGKIKLDKNELKSLIKDSLEEKGYEVNKKNIQFHVTMGSNDPREPSHPTLTRVTIDIDNL